MGHNSFAQIIGKVLKETFQQLSPNSTQGNVLPCNVHGSKHFSIVSTRGLASADIDTPFPSPWVVSPTSSSCISYILSFVCCIFFLFENKSVHKEKEYYLKNTHCDSDKWDCKAGEQSSQVL